MKRYAILTIDDDPGIRKIVNTYLENDGYTVHTAASGTEALLLLNEKYVSAVLLDIMLPDCDGLQLISEIRSRTKVPIVVLSGKSETADRVVGLEMGADDYIIKPFHLREVSARIKTVLRRADVPGLITTGKNEKPPSVVYHFDRWKMDCNKYEIIDSNGNSVSLTDGEFKLLFALIHSPNRVLRREHIFDMTRDSDYSAYDRAVDIQIGRLRKKLNDNPRNPSLIKTVRGIGYIFIGNVVRH